MTIAARASAKATTGAKVAGIACALLLLGLPTFEKALATDVVIVGDSIGEGIATSNGLRSVARRNVSLVRSDVAGELRRIGKGAIAVMSLGLNDAGDPLTRLRKPIEKAITAIEGTGVTVIWLGPPCVLTKLDGKVRDLDGYLQARLAGTPIRYISLRALGVCDKSLRAKDGIHYTFAGYKEIWTRLQPLTRPAAWSAEPEGSREGGVRTSSTVSGG